LGITEVLHSACQSVGMTDLVSSTNISNGHSAAQPTQQITPGSIATTTSGQSNLTAAMESHDCIAAVLWLHCCRRQMVQSYLPGGANVPSHVGTLMTPGEYDWTCASFGPPESTTQTANQSVQPLLHSSQQKVPILNNGRPLTMGTISRKIAPSHGGSGLHLIHDSLGQSERTIQMASQSVQPFSHGWSQSVPIL